MPDMISTGRLISWILAAAIPPPVPPPVDTSQAATAFFAAASFCRHACRRRRQLIRRRRCRRHFRRAIFSLQEPRRSVDLLPPLLASDCRMPLQTLTAGRLPRFFATDDYATVLRNIVRFSPISHATHRGCHAQQGCFDKPSLPPRRPPQRLFFVTGASR